MNHAQPEPEKFQTENKTRRFGWLPDFSEDELTSLFSSERQLEKSFERLIDPNRTQHHLGFQQLGRYLVEHEQVSPRMKKLISSTFYRFPDAEAAQNLIDELERRFKYLEHQEPCTVLDLKTTFVANQALVDLYFFPANNPNQFKRREFVLKTIQEYAPVNADDLSTSQPLTAISEEEIATLQWSHLIASAWNSPKRVSRILQPLVEVTSGKLDAEALKQYRDEAIFQILDLDPTAYPDLEQPIRDSIKTCNEANLQKWVRRLAASQDSRMLTSFGGALLKRINVTPEGPRLQDSVAAIKKYEVEFRTQQQQPMLMRNHQLQEIVSRITSREIDQVTSTLPSRIAEVSHAINAQLQFTFTIGESDRLDDNAFRDLDRILAEHPPQLRDLVNVSGSPASMKSTFEKATASDRRKKQSSINTLTSFDDPELLRQRGLALNQLARVAHRFQEIPYDEADVLARYFLSELPLKERLEVEKAIPSLSHWPNLILAIADRIKNDSTTPERAIPLAQRLLEQDIDDLPTDENWPKMLRLKLISTLLARLGSEMEIEVSNEDADWKRLRIYLDELKHERTQLTSDSSARNTSNDLDATVRLILQLEPSEIERRRIQQTFDFAKNGSNKMAVSVLTNRLLAQTISRQLLSTTSSDQAQRLIQEFRTNQSTATPTGLQLYRSERLVLTLLDLKRKQLVDSMIAGAADGT